MTNGPYFNNWDNWKIQFMQLKIGRPKLHNCEHFEGLKEPIKGLHETYFRKRRTK